MQESAVPAKRRCGRRRRNSREPLRQRGLQGQRIDLERGRAFRRPTEGAPGARKQRAV